MDEIDLHKAHLASLMRAVPELVPDPKYPQCAEPQDALVLGFKLGWWSVRWRPDMMAGVEIVTYRQSDGAVRSHIQAFGKGVLAECYTDNPDADMRSFAAVMRTYRDADEDETWDIRL